jgi:hypothetical protein
VRSDDELRAFFRSELRPHVEAWERLPRLRPLGALEVGVAVLALAACLALRRAEPLWGLLALAALRVARDVSRVQRAFKQDVLRRVFEFVLPGIEYDPGARIAARHVEGSGLFPESWSQESGEDYVSGRLGATDFRFSELRLARRQGKRTEVVFRGLFFAADFHKSFRGRTYLLPDRAERLLGPFGRALQALPRFDRTELVELEDPDFEKRFVCYATDPVEARYVLSTSLMQRLLRMAERTPGSLRVSFVDEALYLALPLAGDLFAVPFGRGAVDDARILAWSRELLAVAGIVEELDLNTRIWRKAPAGEGAPPGRGGGSRHLC